MLDSRRYFRKPTVQPSGTWSKAGMPGKWVSRGGTDGAAGAGSATAAGARTAAFRLDFLLKTAGSIGAPATGRSEAGNPLMHGVQALRVLSERRPLPQPGQWFLGFFGVPVGIFFSF